MKGKSNRASGMKVIGNVSSSRHWRGNVFDVSGISPSLTSCDYKDPRKIVERNRIRKLTPLECERLQGFADNWTKFGVKGEKISDTQRYRCIGNAVTTNVITAIVDEMFDGIYEK